MTRIEKLSVGDTVRLISGGPLMTVVGASALTTRIRCAWFDGDLLCQHEIPPAALRISSSEDEDSRGDRRLRGDLEYEDEYCADDDVAAEDDEHDQDDEDVEGIDEDDGFEKMRDRTDEEMDADLLCKDLASDSEDYARSKEDGWFYSDTDEDDVHER